MSLRTQRQLESCLEKPLFERAVNYLKENPDRDWAISQILWDLGELSATNIVKLRAEFLEKGGENFISIISVNNCANTVVYRYEKNYCESCDCLLYNNVDYPSGLCRNCDLAH